jgi:hypothetical protein
VSRVVLDALLVRLDEQGPIALHVEPGEYTLLRTAVGRVWGTPTGWMKKERQLILAYLRAYTFYRELSEDEQQFWHSFHRELGLAEVPLTNAQYDALWTVLSSHDAVASVQQYISPDRRRRAFVRTIDAAWGIRVMRAQELIEFFDRYYNTTPGQVIDRALLKHLVPAAEEHLLRQAPMYDRIFRQMVEVVDHLVEQDPAVARLPPIALVAHLREAGVALGEPNPVMYFAHKSEHALARLVGVVRHGSRRQYRLQPPRTEVRTPHPYVQAVLAPGQVMVGEPVIFRLAQDESGQGVEVRLPSGQRAMVIRGAATFATLPLGLHVAEVYRHGQQTGSTLSVQVLPPLQWTLTSRPAREPLLELQWQVGRVTLEDGRFQTFRWRPAWEQHAGQWRPQMQSMPLVVGGHEVTVQLTAQSYGARLTDRQTGAVVDRIEQPDELESLALLPLQPVGTAAITWRGSLESRPEDVIEVWPGRPLRDLLDQPPTTHDRLLLEFCRDRHWYRATAVPYMLRPSLLGARLDRQAVHVQVQAPLGAVLSVMQQYAGRQSELICERDAGTEEAGTPIPLRGIPGWDAVKVEISLTVGGVLMAREQLSGPAVSSVEDFLHQRLSRGLGWAPLIRRDLD